MAAHVVTFTWRSDASEESVLAVMSRMRELQHIPGVKAVVSGRNLAKRDPADATHALLVLLDRPEQFEAYGAHPIHDSIVRDLKPILDRAVVTRLG